MENTIILDSGSNPKKSRKPIISEEIFKNLITYPISKDVIRYPKITDKTIQPLFHEIINQNLLALVPNIDIGIQMNMNTNQLIDWINLSKTYGEQLNIEFQKNCENKLKKLINIEEQKERAKNFDMNKLIQLPEDIIRSIYDYLMPETKRILLIARYPNLYSNIRNLNNSLLKKFMENIRKKYYESMINGLYKYNRARCLPQGFYLRFSFSNKSKFIECIDKFIGTCITAITHTPSDYRYFQRKALKIVRALVYVAKTKKVLDAPYAPELEVVQPIKKQRKPRIKK